MSEAEKPRGPVAIDDVAWTEVSHGVRFGSRYRVLSDTRGPDKRKIGVVFEELPPGKQSVPSHYHMVEEEHIIALEGEATLRLGEARYTLKAGEYVCFPAGQRAGHCLINETDKPFRFIVIGDSSPHEVCVYPDSGKIMIDAFDRRIVRDEASLDYFEGEHADDPATAPKP